MYISTLKCFPPYHGRIVLSQDTKYMRMLSNVLRSMSMNTSKIDLDIALKLHNAFAVCFKADQCTNEIVSKLHSPEQIPILLGHAKPNEVASGIVELDINTGLCPASSAEVKLVSFGKEKRNELYKDVLDISKKLYVTSYKNNSERAATELVKFAEWFQ